MSNLNRVEFKPLNGSPSDLSDEDEDDFAGHPRKPYKKFQFIQENCSAKPDLANRDNSRLLLRIYIIILIVIMIVLANWNYSLNDYPINTTMNSGGDLAKRISPTNFHSTLSSHVLNEESNKKLSAKTLPPSNLPKQVPPDQRSSLSQNSITSQTSIKEPSIPSYETYMDSVLQEANYQTNRADQLDDLRISQNERYDIGKWWTIGYRDESKYVTITNYIRAIKQFDKNTSVTFTTQGSGNFLHHTVEVCKRWDGPISIAVFAPESDFNNAITIIKFMRDCLPAPLSSCIKDKVTWHMVYESATGPPPDSIAYPKHYVNHVNYKPFAKHDECPKMSNQDVKQMIYEFSESLTNSSSTQKTHHLYPINVVRNVARLASTTKYVLACDIELYPSVNLVPLFTNYILRHNVSQEYNINKFIFALPIFELKANVTPPKTKPELAELFKREDAIFFHKYVCDYCQDFPNRVNWIDSLDRAGDDELSVFVKTQRDKSRSSWEPIFIGTNEDPLYDDRLTWDGRRDKMGQMYEMCLQDYYILILDNAFLVHSPGIKHIDKTDVVNRVQYMIKNNQIYDSSVTRLKKEYAYNETINKC